MKLHFMLSVVTALQLYTLGQVNAAQPFPQEASRWTDAEKQTQYDAGASLLKKLAEAKASKDAVFNVPKGIYRFALKAKKSRAAFIELRLIENMVIEGNCSMFLFDDAYTGLAISKSNNLTLRNLYLDWDPLVFTQGVVKEVMADSNKFTVQIDPEYLKVADRLKSTKGQFRGVLFDRKTKNIKSNQVGFGLYNVLNSPRKDGVYTLKFRGFYDTKVTDCNMEVGDPIAMFPRLGRAIRIESSGAVTLENVTLYAAPFIGFVEGAGKGPTTYKNCKLIRRPNTDRLIAGNADGFNSAAMEKGPVIDNCEIDSIGDDFINVHGSFYRILKQESPTVIYVQKIGWRGALKDKIEVIVYDAKTNAELVKTDASAEFVRNHVITKSKLIEKDRKWAAAESIKIGAKVSVHRLTLSEPVNLDGGGYVSVLDYVGNGAVIKNSVFRNSLARGIRYQSTNALIQNNRIEFCMGWGITLNGQPGYWGESAHSTGIKIIGNTFSDICIGKCHDPVAITAKAPDSDNNDSYHFKDIVITDNKIIRPGGSGIVLMGVKGLTLKDNRITEYGDREALKPGRLNKAALGDSGYGIVMKNIVSSEISNNTVSDAKEFAKDKQKIVK